MMPSAAGAGVQIHYFSAGEGQPVLAIHDIGGSGELLTAELEPLAQRTRLIGYDRRGYGASEAPDPYLATTVTEQSEDAAALLLGLGASPALLVGVGFGALIALDLSLRRPELVRGALLLQHSLVLHGGDAATTAIVGCRRRRRCLRRLGQHTLLLHCRRRRRC